MMGPLSSNGCGLYHEEAGEGVPILMIHPSGATASTWGSVIGELARIGRVITYDRRGYARTGGRPVRRLSTHTTDAAAILEHLGAAPAVVIGTSSGAMIALDLAVRRPDLVRAVVEHEGPWRFTRHVPDGPQARVLATIGSGVLRRRHGQAAEALLRSAYGYREGGSAWDAFPEGWRQAGRENARAALWDFLITIGNRPSPAELATVGVPVVCSYGARSPDFIVRCTRTVAAVIPGAVTYRIEGAGHAAPFDAPSSFVQLIADAVRMEFKPHSSAPMRWSGRHRLRIRRLEHVDDQRLGDGGDAHMTSRLPPFGTRGWLGRRRSDRGQP